MTDGGAGFRAKIPLEDLQPQSRLGGDNSMFPEGECGNFEIFGDCFSSLLIEKYAVTPKKSQKKRGGRKYKKVEREDVLEERSSNDAEDLAEFADYIATEIFTCLPSELRSLTYHIYIKSPALQNQYSLPVTLSASASILHSLDPSITDSLTAYGLLPPPTTPASFLTPVLNSYLKHVTTPPPPPSSTKAQATHCEICERDWVPLTYHHLIPKDVHAKVLKRGWHPEERLDDVAWLCRQCHSFVHQVAGNEELAREFYTVEMLMGREDVRRWAGWVGRVRWKAR